MIRPFTLICMASAFGAGLYLYQSKHQAQVLDREIMRTIKQAETTRDRTGMLRAEWALLNEPDRLADLARAHLSLQTLKPTQFVAMNDLASRLPAPSAAHPERLPLEAEPEEAPPVPVAQATPAPAVPASATPVPAKPREVANAPEPKAKPETKPTVAAEAKPAEPKPVAKSVERPVLARAEHPAELTTPVHARPFQSAPVIATNDAATAPGTVGAAVLRAMRAQNSAYVPPPPAPVARTYAPPAYVQPAYTPPSYAQPTYAQPAYAAPAMSVLGGHTNLPPPVPFAAR